MKNEDLNALSALAVSGDGAALSRLCERLENPVYRLCLRMLGDARDAEDAAQDVLVKVLTHLGSFEGRSGLLTWVHHITVRHVLNSRKSRAEERSIDEDGFAELLEQGLAWGATQPAPTPEDLTLLTEVRLSCTQGMLLMLNREERLALVLVELLGFDAAEAAEISETSHEAMRQRLSRARLRLGAFLERSCGVANAQAACRCEKQLAGKTASGLKTERLALLAQGDLPAREEVSLAAAELRAVRSISSAFHQRGDWRAPGRLRERMQQLLPTVLGPG